MFNAPRRMAGQSIASSTFLASSTPLAGGDYPDPLAQSTPNPGPSAFGDVDPWSAVPSPVPSIAPRRGSVDDVEDRRIPEVIPTAGKEGSTDLFSDPPPLYSSLFDQLDPSPSGEVPLSAVHRLLSTSRLPAASIEQIINLTARDRSSLARKEFFSALALVALAQSDEDISLERLRSAYTTLPLPTLQPSLLSPPGYEVASPQPTSLASPWDSLQPQNGQLSIGEITSRPDEQSSSMASEAERGYWKRLEHVDVSLVTEREGWFLQKYRVESDKRAVGAVSRRYSDFVWLLDCLVKRYPFRLLASLPPKKIGPDASFLEQRRKALRRFINMIVNHPVTRDDGAVNVFLTEPNFEAWRKRTKVSTDEESASKKLNPAQEMGIPADLEEKLGALRKHLPTVLASYQKLVMLAERSLARLQAASADASRFALALHTVGEEMPTYCHSAIPGNTPCSLCRGVGRGLGEVGESWTLVAEQGEKRATAIVHGSIEALKTQRDLHIAFRDLFVRHDKLSKDPVDALRKKVEGRQKKVDAVRSGQKPGWEVEVDKLVAANDLDTSTVNTLLGRRVFIRACMWHELAVVFHSRQGAQATLGWCEFSADEAKAAAAVAGVWEALGERLKTMPAE